MSSARRFILAVIAAFSLPAISVAQTPAATAAATAAPTVAPTVAPATVTAVPVAPSTAPAATTPTADEGYVIGPEDVIEVSVLGQPEFRTQARVETDGSIALPFLGKQQVNGQTPLSLAAAVSSRLKAGGYYTNPVATVTVVSFASRYVIVLGEVAQPGLQPVNRSYRVSEIIARAGGLKPSGAPHVILRRVNGQELKLDFKKLAVGSESDDPVVYPGDKLFVPEAETFFIYGQVNAPGTFVMQEQMTIRKALARAGGLTPLGSDKRVQVYRNGQPAKVSLESPVGPGDVIVVGERIF